MFGKNVGILERGIISVVQFLESENALLNGVCGQEIRVAGKPIHDIHLILQVGLLLSEQFYSISGMLIDESLNHKVQIVGLFN